jgi:hypothetical protein
VPSRQGCASTPTAPHPDPALTTDPNPDPNPNPNQVRLNADNLDELERIDLILAEVYGGG